MIKNIDKNTSNAQFKLFNKNLKSKLKAINKYDDDTLNLLFYKLNKEVTNLNEEELNNLKEKFESEISFSRSINEISISRDDLDNTKIKKTLKDRLNNFEDKIRNIVEFREEALLGLFSFFLFVWFLVTGLLNIQLFGRIMSFVATIIFFALIDKFKKKHKIQSDNKISSALKGLLFMISFSLAFCFLPKTQMPSNFYSPSTRVSATQLMLKLFL